MVFFETGFKGSCEPFCECWRPNQSVLHEQKELLSPLKERAAGAPSTYFLHDVFPSGIQLSPMILRAYIKYHGYILIFQNEKGKTPIVNEVETLYRKSSNYALVYLKTCLREEQGNPHLQGDEGTLKWWLISHLPRQGRLLQPHKDIPGLLWQQGMLSVKSQANKRELERMTLNSVGRQSHSVLCTCALWASFLRLWEPLEFHELGSAELISICLGTKHLQT